MSSTQQERGPTLPLLFAIHDALRSRWHFPVIAFRLGEHTNIMHEEDGKTTGEKAHADLVARCKQ